MEHADDIQHCAHMVAANVDILRDNLLGEPWGYLVRLEMTAHGGGFVTDKTEEANKLKNAAIELRNLADRIALARESLIINERREENVG
jgi:hypothetical protein